MVRRWDDRLPGTRKGPPSAYGAARTRVLGAFGAAALAFCIAWLLTPWQISALIGYSVGAIVFIVWVWMKFGRLDGEATAAYAGAEDSSRRFP